MGFPNGGLTIEYKLFHNVQWCRITFSTTAVSVNLNSAEYKLMKMFQWEKSHISLQ